MNYKYSYTIHIELRLAIYFTSFLITFMIVSLMRNVSFESDLRNVGVYPDIPIMALPGMDWLFPFGEKLKHQK